jgi:hypothetical protein
MLVGICTAFEICWTGAAPDVQLLKFLVTDLLPKPFGQPFRSFALHRSEGLARAARKCGPQVKLGNPS